MKCQSLFSVKNKKNIYLLFAENFSQHAKHWMDHL